VLDVTAYDEHKHYDLNINYTTNNATNTFMYLPSINQFVFVSKKI
jgi:hypothetical protein